MRVRAALVTAAIAVMAISALSVPAQAASWLYVGKYTSKSKCVDAGQQYVREGFSTYECLPPYLGGGYYQLRVK